MNSMIPLIDTVTGFAAIMLVLSLLVKSLTSLIKNHVDFYSRNLKHEVDRLAMAVLGKSWDVAVNELADPGDRAWFEEINWERLGEEMLTKNHMEWLLTKLGAPPNALDHLEDRLEVHAANISYAFSTRMKNVALLLGLLLCLALDVNSFRIWQSLYSDQQLRTTFATTYAQAALQSAAQSSSQQSAASTQPTPAPPAGQAGGTSPGNPDQEKKQLNESTRTFMNKLTSFQKDVSFGVGRIWTSEAWKEAQKNGRGPVAYALLELLGSLSTGVLISIGAAYWHDLLRALSSLRQPAKE